MQFSPYSILPDSNIYTQLLSYSTNTKLDRLRIELGGRGYSEVIKVRFIIGLGLLQGVAQSMSQLTPLGLLPLDGIPTHIANALAIYQG